MTHKRITFTVTLEPAHQHILDFLELSPDQLELLKSDLTDLLEDEAEPYGVLESWDLKLGGVSDLKLE